MIRLRLARFVRDDEVRMPGEQRERHDPLALEPAVGGGLRGGGQLTLGEPVEFGDVVEDDGEIVRVVQQILLEASS